jgi:hypothetical protein
MFRLVFDFSCRSEDKTESNESDGNVEEKI